MNCNLVNDKWILGGCYFTLILNLFIFIKFAPR